MIRLAALFAAAATLSFLALASDKSAEKAEALLASISCDAKIGVIDNEGLHPFLWPFIQEMSFTPQPAQQDGSQEFALGPSTASPVIPITGVVAADRSVSGSGTGMYSSFQTGVAFAGDISYYDMNHVFPRRITGDYTVGPDNLPGNKTIVIRSDCFFDPPAELSDPDNDGNPGIRHDTFGFNSLSAGRASGSLQSVVYRDAQNAIQQVNITDADEITTSDSKQGPFETIAKRRFYDTWGWFGGSIAPSVDSDPDPESFFDATLWQEIGSPTINSIMSGVLSGRFQLGYRDVQTPGSADGHAAGFNPAIAVVSFEFDFHSHGLQPFNFQGVSSGDWSWRRDPSREITVTSLNLATGQASLTVPVLLDAENLRGIYPGTPAAPAGADGLPGEPLRFTENVNIGFPPLGLITSAMDNCPDDANPDQADADANGLGDACEGFFWMDGNCDAEFDSEDVLATLSRRSGADFDRPSACPEFDTSFGGLKAGDWDCDDNQDSGDVIAALLAAAVLPLPPEYPASCPDPEEFVPAAPN
jgi:hypothetical protein